MCYKVRVEQKLDEVWNGTLRLDPIVRLFAI